MTESESTQFIEKENDMVMCQHSQDFETCRFGCTFRKKEELKVENDELKKRIEELLEASGFNELTRKALLRRAKAAEEDWQLAEERIKELEAENEALRRPLEAIGFKVDGMLAVGNELGRQDKRIKQLEGEEPIPFGWWEDCPKIAQMVMERLINRNFELDAEIKKLIAGQQAKTEAGS